MKTYAFSFVPALMLLAALLPGATSAVAEKGALAPASPTIEVGVKISVEVDGDTGSRSIILRAEPEVREEDQRARRPLLAEAPASRELGPVGKARRGVMAMRIVARITLRLLERWLERHGW
jgi:hypothetical protein